MRKIVTLIVIFVFLFSFSAFVTFARGSKEKDTEKVEKKAEKKAEQVTITVLMGIDAAGKHMGDRAVDFEKETGIKVNMIEVEWDTMVNKQSVALTAREPTYDIVDCSSFMLPEYVPILGPRVSTSSLPSSGLRNQQAPISTSGKMVRFTGCSILRRPLWRLNL